MNLFFRKAGTGPPLIILHGLFGSSDNWFSLSKILEHQFTVFTVDQRNHGQSPHHDVHNYRVLTEDLEEFISRHKISRPAILGHSMGGKTAMNFAVKNPHQLSHLIVVDIMPRSYPNRHDRILEGLKAINISALTSRQGADLILQGFVQEPDVRQFLLKNLARTELGGFQWKVNLPALEKNAEAMGAGQVFPGTFEGPTLFVKGGRSDYFAPGDEKTVAGFFPNVKWVTLETGHWVQVEKPREFADAVIDFMMPA